MSSFESSGLTSSSIKIDQDRQAASLYIGKIDEATLFELLEKDSGTNTTHSITETFRELEVEIGKDSDLIHIIKTYLNRDDPVYKKQPIKEHLFYLPISIIFNMLSLAAAKILKSSVVFKCTPHHTNSPQSSQDIEQRSKSGKPDLIMSLSNEIDVVTTLTDQKAIVSCLGLDQAPTFPSINKENRIRWSSAVSFGEAKSDNKKLDSTKKQQLPYCFDYWAHKPGLY
jgi:hypothetical protein